MISVLPSAAPAPFKVLCACIDRALGEVIIRTIYAATIKQHVKDAHVTFYTRLDRSYKASVISLASAYLDKVISVTDDHVMPLEFYYSALDRFPVPGSEEFRQAGHSVQDVILPPSALLEIGLLKYPNWPSFSIPRTHQDEVFTKLRAAGLRDDNWCCVVHYRQPDYEFRPKTPYRDVSSDAPFEALARHIIRDLGGQVVRIGHKEMREWEDMPDGFVDLSRSDDFMLHAAAVSVSRFAVMTMSGPTSLCAPFGVPAMVSNAVGIAASGADPGFMLPKHMIDPDGFRADIGKIIAAGQWTTEAIRLATSVAGWELEDNTLDELKAGVAKLYAQTQPWGIPWRQPAEPVAVVKGAFNPQGNFIRKVNVWSPE